MSSTANITLGLPAWHAVLAALHSRRQEATHTLRLLQKARPGPRRAEQIALTEARITETQAIIDTITDVIGR